MAPGHDAHIVAGPDVNVTANLFQVPDNGSCCLGKYFTVGKFLPVVHDHAPEPHMGQDRHQLLGHMSAAEDIDRPCLDQGFDVISASPDFLLKGPACKERFLKRQLCLLRPVHACKACAFAVKPHLPAGFVRYVQEQPAVLIPAKGVPHLGAEFCKCPVIRADILKVNHHVAAAHHADISHLVPVQGKSLGIGSFMFHGLHGREYGLVFHCAAAHGPFDGAVLPHQHA